ncbi:protein FAM151B isoform X3 [Mauremys reevesii]|uniref:protein FAM151B isoform X3 n=1 Tax=Mauremys reevesii TaxID=260615 RepID=UPI00193FFD5A|nr:protein FAM151B isoform X3 [Mauremys reevesii]
MGLPSRTRPSTRRRGLSGPYRTARLRVRAGGPRCAQLGPERDFEPRHLGRRQQEPLLPRGKTGPSAAAPGRPAREDSHEVLRCLTGATVVHWSRGNRGSLRPRPNRVPAAGGGAKPAGPRHLRPAMEGELGAWNENVLDYFLNTNQIKTRDGAEIIWYHAANNKSQMKEAIQSAAHMVEADILLCGEEEGNGEPIMAHPPETKSDNTLQAWLNEIVNTKKGIKLDFKSLAAVKPSMMLLEGIKLHLRRPVWINADILPGPNGSNTVVDAKRFLDTVTSFCPDVTLSLGWTTGWQPQQCNKGYSWAMVKEMAQICDALTQPVTFPVRAALVRQSKSELVWLLQKSNRYSLTVWTGRHDKYSIEDLLYLRENFDKNLPTQRKIQLLFKGPQRICLKSIKHV